MSRSATWTSRLRAALERAEREAHAAPAGDLQRADRDRLDRRRGAPATGRRRRSRCRWRTSRRPKVVPGLAQPDGDRASGVPGRPASALGGWAVAPSVARSVSWPLAVALRSTLTGYSAPETAVGGSAVIAAGGRPRPRPRRCGRAAGPRVGRRRSARPAAARASGPGVLRASSAAIAATPRGGDRAPAGHDGLAADADRQRAAARPRGRAWAARRRVGPWAVMRRDLRAVRRRRSVGARSGSPKRDRRCRA